jgi:phosphonate transport system substrate-binding protein
MRLLKNIQALLCIGFLATVVLGGCTDRQKTEAVSDNTPEVKATFGIGLLPAENVFLQKRRYRPLAEYLSKRLDMDVRTKLLDSYDAVYAQMLDRSVDAAFFGSLSYVALHSRLPLEPIARPLRANGGSTYRGIIFALKGKGITEDIGTWKGKRIALVEKSTTSGYLFPAWYLMTKGIRNPARYFRKVVYAGSHEAAIVEVLDGHADIGCANDAVFNRYVEKRPRMRDEFVVLASSLPFPSDTLGVRKDIDPGLELKMKETLLGMDKTEEGREVLDKFGAKRFVVTRGADYGPILDMLKAIGLRPEDIALEAIGRKGESEADDVLSR